MRTRSWRRKNLAFRFYEYEKIAYDYALLREVCILKSYLRTLFIDLLVVGVCVCVTKAQTMAPATHPVAPEVTAKPGASAANWQSLKKGMSLAEVKAILGEPTQVDDLQQGFAGLSPTEDQFLVQNRDKLSQRAVWYVEKLGNFPKLNDVWYAAYFDRKDSKLVARLSNPPPNPKNGEVEKAVALLIGKARASYPEAKKRYLARLPNGQRFVVVTVLRDKQERSEQVFISVTGIEGEKITGSIASKIGIVEGFKNGDHYTFSEGDLLDWMITHPDGTNEGNVLGKFFAEYQEKQKK